MNLIITAATLLVVLLVPVAPANAGQLLPATGPEPGIHQIADVDGIGIRLVDVPAATQDDPRARVYIVDRLSPGNVIHRRVEVQNNTDSTQSVRVYSGAAHIDAGTFIGEADPAENELTTWTTLDTSALSLNPGQAALVTVTIAVPADAAEGEQYAAIWAEMRGATPDGSGIVQASRAGIRIYLSVGPGNGAAADFTVDSLTAARDAQGNPTVSTRVTNTGGRALDIEGSLALSAGPAGLAAGPFAVEQTVTIAPGATQDVLIALDSSLPNGPWTASLTLTSGLLEHTAAATLTFPESGQGETVAPDTGIPILWVIIITVVAVVLLLALAAGTFWFLRRRRILRRTQAAELRM